MKWSEADKKEMDAKLKHLIDNYGEESTIGKIARQLLEKVDDG